MVSGGTGDPWPGCRPHGRPRTRPHHASPAEGQESRGCAWPPPGDDQDLGLVHPPSNVGETVLSPMTGHGLYYLYHLYPFMAKFGRVNYCFTNLT